jgi:DNA-binding HxlR family transcriptional regulator
MASREYGQYGGLTQALELVGERWATLIVRDLLAGPRRFGELAAGLPRIPSNILAVRLKELQAGAILRRVPHSRVIVYELTPYGRALEPALLALGTWGLKGLEAPRTEQIITPDALAMDLRMTFQPAVAAGLPPTVYGAQLEAGELLIRVSGPEFDVAREAGTADLTFSSGAEMYRLMTGDLSAEGAIAPGPCTVAAGDDVLIARFANTFHLAA